MVKGVVNSKFQAEKANQYIWISTVSEQAVHHVQNFSSVVSLAYYQKLVKSLSSTRKNWGAVTKENGDGENMKKIAAS